MEEGMINQLNIEVNLSSRTRCGKETRNVPTDNKMPSFAFRWMVLVISLVLFTLLFPVMANADPPLVQQQGPSPGEDVIVWGPYITNTTPNSTIIHWKTLEPSIGRVSFVLAGTHSPGISRLELSEENPSVLHHVQLNNLEPGQRYSYWIEKNSLNYSFRTQPLNGPFTFIVYGDTREQLPWWNQSTHHALVAERIAKEPDCLFVVHTGDLVNDPADEGEWGRFFEAAGPMLANTTFYPVPGNHEGDLGEYQDYFGASPWYNFTVAGYEFIFLDSNTLTPVLENQQNRWINQTMFETSMGRFVFLHHPMYTSEPNHWGGFLDIRERWEQLFIEHNVLGVFSAHVHAYEHFYENGIHYFTIGTGGAPFYPLAEQKPEGYRYSMENTLAYARVTVDPMSGSGLIEVIKIAEVHDGQIMVYPPGTIAERIIITRSQGKQSDALTKSLSVIYPLFKSPFRFFR
jgi:acid phosphatase type 7